MLLLLTLLFSYNVDAGDTGIQLGCIVRVQSGLLERSDLDVVRVDQLTIDWTLLSQLPASQPSACRVVSYVLSRDYWNALTLTSSGLIS